MPARPITVVVSSDQEIVRVGVVGLLRRHPERVVVRVPAAGERPAAQVIVHDVTDEPDPERLAERLGELAGSGTPVVALGARSRPEVADHALAVGAVAAVPLAVTSEGLVSMLESVAAGIPVSVPASVGSPVPMGEVALTQREVEVVRLVAQGLTNQQIADLMYLSINSVKTYIRTSYRKMGVGSRSQAVLWAVRHGLG